jgi:hypothetical protein
VPNVQPQVPFEDYNNYQIDLPCCFFLDEITEVSNCTHRY